MALSEFQDRYLGIDNHSSISQLLEIIINDNNNVDCKTIRRQTAEKEIKNNDLDFWAEFSLWKFSFEIWKFRSGNRV